MGKKYERIDSINLLPMLNQPKQWQVKATYVPFYATNVSVYWPPAFAAGVSSVAVARRIRREARKLRLPVYGSGEIVLLAITTRKAIVRFNELLKFCNGESIAKTAKNNFGRSTQ